MTANDLCLSTPDSPTPRCNRRPCRGVQDQADFSESLCHLSSSSPPGSRLNANRWAACGLWTVFVWVRFASLRVCSARRAVIQDKRPRRLSINRCTAIALVHSRIARCSFVALNLVQPNTAMQPTCFVGAILPSGGMFGLSRSTRPVLFCRTRLMAIRWVAILSSCSIDIPSRTRRTKARTFRPL